MKTANMTVNKGQVYSVGNYLMNDKILGKGHFARVEEATHRIIGKKVAIKVIDLTCIKEEYARRNLHREPRVMARLRHPCIAALYETMMHGPRLYVVMEAAGGGDLCAHVLGVRGTARGLPEARARALATQLVSAVRHMHTHGVVHRDLKMENIMLDTTKQFIKIVDFGLSNIWNSGAALRTPCGSLEYAAPELFVDGRRYGPEVDLWSIGVIVYGLVTGGLPFTGGGGGAGGEGKSRPQLRAAISRGFSRKQRAALACVSNECKLFIQQLLEPNVEQRMKIEDAAKHRWVKRPGMRMKTHPLVTIDPKINREMYRQIGELCGQSMMDVITQIKAEPFGSLAGIYNIKSHLHQMQSVPGTDLLWSSNPVEPRPITPPEFRGNYEETISTKGVNTNEINTNAAITNGVTRMNQLLAFNRNITPPYETKKQAQDGASKTVQTQNNVSKISPRTLRPNTVYGLKPPLYKVYDNGDCPGPRLASIEEHCNDTSESKVTKRCLRVPCVRKISLEEERPRLNSCPVRNGDKRADSYRKTGDGFPSWRSSTGMNSQPRILLQNNATNIKRASLGNIISPNSSSNGHCRSERGTPVGWYSTRSVGKETTHLQRLRRTVPMK